MLKRRFRLPSPALVISMITLSIVLGGTAVAASTAKHGDKKADTKLIKKLAPTLSVKHAKTANSAANATHATSADSATHATSATSATNATTAANANALGGVAASNYVQRSGTIYVQLGHSNWSPFTNTDPITVTHYTDTQGLTATSTTTDLIRADPVLPNALYGKALALDGVRICYHTNTGNDISGVYLIQNTQTTNGQGGANTIFHDGTMRTDAACRLYSPPSPVTLTSADQLSIMVVADWTTANTPLYMGNTTLILHPTSTAATASKNVSRSGRAPGASPGSR
jgi:hypothetical protein